ncbi:hypothetical protein DFJ58DRAFT_792623 [Suillus subalutaceus]|uniref:uncharacterized protein n=1 Tax=Suillus subalutaceus TaxID=48586 RepID=UPI001B86C6E8|nr:uncharacterized protein DFJ58DRAFT_792623 [Suillus subalutaceus]KAG1851293.1 hypothetical protein DFJ58DRAFT_792623 [Suillus subalutaceus]
MDNTGKSAERNLSTNDDRSNVSIMMISCCVVLLLTFMFCFLRPFAQYYGVTLGKSHLRILVSISNILVGTHLVLPHSLSFSLITSDSWFSSI